LAAEMSTIRDWLSSLNLSEYADHFEAQRIVFEILPDLTDQDLEKLGVLLGDRRKILRAARELDAARSAPGVRKGEGPRLGDAAERRQLSVMFVDLVGSTEFSARLDPEDFAQVIGSYHRICASAVAEFEGSIAKYLGDGVLAYFGYPEAHEDDAERAIRAGLRLIEAMSAVDAGSGIRPQVRIGVATGVVVVGELIGEGSAQERLAVGETLNLAARIQAASSPDCLVVAESTRQLAGAAFAYTDLGRQDLKGVAGGARLWRVLGESEARGRFDVRIVKGLTPFVGRSEEIGLLRRHWERARDGEGQVVLLSAPAGFGKSRIAATFREEVRPLASACPEFFGSPFHTASRFYPFIGQLEWAAGISRADSASQKLDKLEALLEGAEEERSKSATLLAALLSIPFGDRYAPLQINEQVQKQRTMDELLERLISSSVQGPALAIFEDVHWFDPTSLELMGVAVHRAAHLPIMILVTHRPEFLPPWLELGHVTLLKLSNLARRDAIALIRKAADDKALPDPLVEQISAKAQGVPLFIEEITRSILESGDLEEQDDRYVLRHGDRKFAIPSTLQDSLVARLDRLGTARDVALAASIIGREFPYELIAAVYPLPRARLETDLERLVRSDLLSQQGAPPNSRYVFKHALIRDAAFRTVLKARRRELHRRIADELAARFPEIAEREPELLAHHYTEAEATDRALEYWRRAANRAASSLAYVEALGHVESARKLILRLPGGIERDEWELAFLSIEGTSRMALDGWDSPSASRIYGAAREVAERLGRPQELFRSVWGQWMGAHSNGQHVRAHALYQEILGFLDRLNEPEYVVQAHHAGGSQMVAEGAPRAAMAHIDHLLANYRMDVHGNLALFYGAHDPGCCSLGMRALSLLMMGYVELSEAESVKSLELSERLDHKPSISHTHMFRAEFCIILDRIADADAHLRASISIAEQYSLAGYLAADNIMQGWVRSMTGDGEDGVRQAEAALEALKAIPSRRFHFPIRTAIVGRARAAAGDIRGALALYEAALEAAVGMGERWYEPELLRLKAEMLIAQADLGLQEAVECLAGAIAMAQQQDAKLWELRSATSLARLWATLGRRADALGLITPIHDWFTEGLDMPDLTRARTLMAELSA
jgi:class 3 adenylate cyclase/predicted ATPase